MLHRIEDIISTPFAMARPLKIEISESVEYLEKSLRHARTPSQKNYKCFGGSKADRWSNINSWVTAWDETVRRLADGFRNTALGGLIELLAEKNSSGKPWKIDGEILEQLQVQLQQPEGFQSYGEIQQWL